MKKMTIETPFDLTAFRNYKRQLADDKEDFIIYSTGYSKIIETGRLKYIFTESTNKGKTFSMYQKIKKDVLASGVIIDEVPQQKIMYYNLGDFIQEKAHSLPDKLINIDLNNAYLQVLLNNGLISKETFEYCLHPKAARLKAAGMLARRRLMFEYVQGKLVKWDYEKSTETEKYFFICCYEVDKLINKIALLWPDYYLFYWFDGIYLKEGAPVEEIMQYIKENNFESKSALLFNCVFRFDKTAVSFKYNEIKKGAEISKTLAIPYNQKQRRQLFNRYINELRDEITQHQLKKEIKPIKTEIKKEDIICPF